MYVDDLVVGERYTTHHDDYYPVFTDREKLEDGSIRYLFDGFIRWYSYTASMVYTGVSDYY